MTTKTTEKAVNDIEDMIMIAAPTRVRITQIITTYRREAVAEALGEVRGKIEPICNTVAMGLSDNIKTDANRIVKIIDAAISNNQ